MVKVDKKEFAEKWSRRLKGATEDIRKGVERVTEAPGKKAAAKKDKMKARLIEKIDDGTWEKRVAAVPLDEWKEKFISKGIGRISAGVDSAVPDVEDFADELLSYEDTVQKEVHKMPDLTLEDNVARASKWIREMAKFKRSK